MKKIKNLLLSKGVQVMGLAGFFTGIGLGLPARAYAACNAESVIPCYIQEIKNKIGGSSGANTYINDRVRWGLTILFVIVFIVAIVYSALAAIKFMTSQGDSGKLEESKGAVKAILMGFAAMIIAIIGIFVILYVLGATSTPGEVITPIPT